MFESWNYSKILILLHLFGFVLPTIDSKYQAENLEICRAKFCSTWEEKYMNFSDARNCKPPYFYFVDIQRMEEVQEFLKNLSIQGDFINSSSPFITRSAAAYYSGGANTTVTAIVCLTEGSATDFFSKWYSEILKHSNIFVTGFVLGMGGSALLILLIIFMTCKFFGEIQSEARYSNKKPII